MDIDLDFFLSEITRRSDTRVVDPRLRVWSESDTRRFLEVQCRLDANAPPHGILCTHHHEVFSHWKRLIAAGELTVPFDVTHIDAHADLGLGLNDCSYIYVFSELLHQPLDHRSSPKIGSRYGLAEGNFLTFAIACRWIRELTYVHHPELLVPDRIDIGDQMFKDFDSRSGYLQLKCYRPEDLADPFRDLRHISPLALEPEVPLITVNGSQFAATAPFDLAFLTQSPDYTPAAADRLIPVIREYLR